MDFGGYRADPRLRPTPAIPVTTITTGIPLSDRFKHIQQVSDDRVFSQDGYGLPAAHRYGGGQDIFGGAARTVPKAVSMRNKQLALALAKRSRAPQPLMSNPIFRNRGAVRGNPRPVQSRLGISKVNRQQTKLPMRGLMRRGVSNRGGAGRGMVLNRVQKAPGAINRNRNNQVVQGGNRGQRGAVRGGPKRGVGVGRGGRGGRGGNRGGKADVSKTGPVSKEDLDSELDSYMSHSKAYLDKQLDDYMLQAKAAAAAVTAGTVLIEESDVNMTDA